MGKRHNRTGRSTTERFVQLPHWLLRSPAWQHLSPVGRCVFIELLSIYNGRNNGYIALSARDAAERVRCSKDTANRAFGELKALGFVEISIVGAFHRKTRHATEYRVTVFSCDRTGRLATKDFMRWKLTENPFSRSDCRDSQSHLRDSNQRFRKRSAASVPQIGP